MVAPMPGTAEGAVVITAGSHARSTAAPARLTAKDSSARSMAVRPAQSMAAPPTRTHVGCAGNTAH